MPFYKAWDVRREKRKLIVADSFADFLCKGENFIQLFCLKGRRTVPWGRGIRQDLLPHTPGS